MQINTFEVYTRNKLPAQNVLKMTKFNFLLLSLKRSLFSIRLMPPTAADNFGHLLRWVLIQLDVSAAEGTVVGSLLSFTGFLVGKNNCAGPIHGSGSAANFAVVNATGFRRRGCCDRCFR